MKRYRLIINGEKYEAKVLSYKDNQAKVNVNGIDYIIDVEQENTHLTQPVIQTSKSYLNPEKVSSSRSGQSSGRLIAPIPGIVMSVHKTTGDRVDSGDVILTLEAMKMESEMVAPVSGKISEITVAEGDSVSEGDLLVVIEAPKTKDKGRKAEITHKDPARERTDSAAASASSGARQQRESAKSMPAKKHDGSLRAPIPGTVLDIKVKEGDHVTPEDVVLILEAMKMESEIRPDTGGKVQKIHVSKGKSVNEGDVLMEIGE